MSAGFLTAAREHIGDGCVYSEQALRLANANVEGAEGGLIAAVRASSTEQVLTLVKLAREHQQPLHPWACGLNWGYGTRQAPRPGCVGLDLSTMNRIRHIDPLAGTATVEPGVTQAQLAEALSQQGLPFYVDVTGAPGGTSLLGNTLERGVAYNSLRADTLRHLEVVLGDGTLLRTGLSNQDSSTVSNRYRHGVGPGLTELFLQSNYGVVTAMCIGLRPLPERQLPFRAAPLPGVGPGALAEAVADARRALGLQSIVHIGDRERLVTTLAPLVFGLSAEWGSPMTREDAEALVASVAHTRWSAIGVLEGTRRQVNTTASELRRHLKGSAKVTFMPQWKLALGARVGRLLPGRRLALVSEASRALSGLTHGAPSDAPLRALHWPLHEREPSWQTPELGRTGWLLASPLLPARGGHVEPVLEQVRALTRVPDLRCGMTLNVLSDSLLQLVISLSWPLDDTRATAAAQDCRRRLRRSLSEMGYPSYRLGVGEQRPTQSSFWQVGERIGRALDPDGVLSPGRYGMG